MRRLLFALASALLVSVLGAPSASAETGGFFEFDEPINQHTTITVSGGGNHALHFVAPELSSEVGCGSTLEGTEVWNTTAHITLRAAFSGCTVTSSGAKVPIDSNGCWITLKMAKAPVHETEQTAVLECPEGKSLTITRPECTIVIPNQFFTGVTYGQATNGNKPALTVSFDSKLIFRYEAGVCTFFGTNQTGTLRGSQTLKGWRTDGEPAKVDIEWDESLGHFVSGVEHPTITGTENAKHHLDFILASLGGEIGCKKSTYSLTSTSETAQVTVVAPAYSECTTTGTENGVLVGVNECSYRFDVLAGSTNETEQKVDLVCPPGKFVSVLHLSCGVRVPPQNDIGKITYTTVEEAGDHAITMDVNAELKVEVEAGACTMLGTNQTATLKGSVLVKAFATAGEQVDLTAT
jgi:hypothetical protein